MAQVRKSKRNEKSSFRGLEPTKSILENKIIKLGLFSVIGAVSVIFTTQQIGAISESKSIAEIGLIFG
ncbi:MAG: hypothetical protein OEQ12_07630, partial [Nitrosopumilus sp.]|nr:hypothetical protein [Nitrosopumilus sp.]